ncbi:hypothetical protein SAMN04488020_102219 [Palleronia marisminoris]|uniref:DUF2125 domain-containing protein n=1 Tax=Palleronia marisminoris TaxID=315423 RepID=A0A1Y5RYQ1_9RHOB|nr:DUF2125 domain-containing protein [Palleronia marisminoris]SFG43286.1 hypothetical protein SAMN04488020_102219 [Palleronia marisminoris]SLN27195.1 hypothetical protein PAM7066_01062 [Palleronia marisminoris]
MRLLILAILLAAVGWSAYWFVGANALESTLREAIDDARADGVEVEVASLDVTGFPNRFDTIIEEPRIRTASGIEWSAPFLQVFALSYRPNQLIAALPNEQTVAGPFGTAEITTESARASMTLTTALALDHANLVVDDLRIASDDLTLAVARVLAATRVPEDAEDGRVQNIGLTLDEVALPPAFADQLGVAGVVDGATLDATVTLAEPIDRGTFEGEAIELRQIDISRLDIDWGEVGLDASGALSVGADGVLTGEISVAFRNWSRAVDIAVAAGLLPPNQAEQVRLGLRFVAGDGDRLELPLSFRDGLVYLGPFPLGDAPRL